MTPHIETFAAAASTVLAGIAGSKVGVILANLSPTPLPEWMNWALGPFGALIGVLFALRWMAGRLAKADQREEDRRLEREADRRATNDVLIGLVRDTNATTSAAVEVMRDVKETLADCHRAKGSGLPNIPRQ